MSATNLKIPIAGATPKRSHSGRIFGYGEMAELTRCFDWSSTPLGPVEDWPDTLVTTVNMLLSTRHPMFLWWGPELIQFYNDGYRPSIREDKHPKALGQRGIECWPEIWHIIGSQIEDVMTRAEATWHRNQLVPIHRNGKLEDVYWTYSYSPVRDGDGAIRGCLVVCSETTDEVLGERRLRESEARFRRLIERANVGVLIGDVHGRLNYVNPAMLDLLGFSSEEVAAGNVRWTELTPPEFVDRDALAVRQLRERGTFDPYEKAYIAKDGRRIPLLVGGSVLEAASGSAGEEVAVFVTDLTSLRQAENALRQTEKLAAVGRLASSIAHEINNPLEAVTNLLYLIEEMTAPGELKNYAALAQRELARVSNIATQTLRFHRQSTRATSTRVSELLDGVLNLFQARITNADISVERRYGGAAPLLSYEADLRQVFTNLVANALDAGPDKIVLRERDATDWQTGQHGVRVTVADTGRGMSPLTRRHIFDPFFTTKGITGTGLGLWVATEILEKHKAKIRVRSSQDRQKHGTVFSLFFPYNGPENSSAP